MQKANLDELIAQLAAATDGSEALDEEIAACWAAAVGRVWFTPPWTRSLEAALTLVPEGWHWAASHNGDGWYEASLCDAEPKTQIAIDGALARSAALAICIACLRALA